MQKYILLLLFSLFYTTFQAQTTRYVSATATGNNDGTSWEHAFTDLQSALALSTAGDQVWVAQGTYKPTAGTDRSVSFEPVSGVQLYGGFSGTETAVSQRNWVLYPTVLSGDIGVAGDSTDNCLNIMYLFEPDSNTVVDGFVFRHGQAVPPVPYSARSRQMCGGGLYIMGFNGDAYARVAHCRFEYCTARNYGGGMMINGGGTGSSSAPSVVDCDFWYNRAVDSGGGMARYGGSVVERPQDVDSCRFTGNSAFNGGGVFMLHNTGTDTFAIRNCRFYQNRATQNGGAMHALPNRNEEEKFIIDKVVFDSNIAKNAPVFFGSIFSENFDGYFEFSNSIVENSVVNGVGALKVIQVDMPGTGNIRYYYNIIRNHDLPSVNFLYIAGLFSSFEFSYNSFIDIVASDLLLTDLTGGLYEGNYFSNSKEGASIILGGYLNTYINNVFYSNGGNSLGNIVGEVSNCVFAGNLRFLSGSHLFNNCAFITNIPNTAAAHEEFFGNASTTLSNCWFSSVNPALIPSNITVMGPLLTQGSPGFVDETQGDYRLLPCSPLINAGNSALVPTNMTDIVGQPRIQGAAVDIGPYESGVLSLGTEPVVLPTCAETSTGQITVIPENACLPLTYAWSGPVAGTGNTASGLPAGTYTLTLTDGKNETITLTATVPISAPPQAAVQTTPVMCGTSIGGTATPEVNGTYPPYQFLWSTGSTDSVLYQVPAGNYLLTLTDARGCTGTVAAQVNKMGNISVNITAAEPLCYNSSDGLVEITPATGQAPFRWLWATGDTTTTLNNLASGTYSGFITDAFNCALSWNIPLSAPDTLVSNAVNTDATGPNTANGSIDLLPTGGTGTLSLQWSTGAITASISDLLPGLYTVTITDDNGCTRVETHEVKWVVSSGEPWASAVKVFPVPARSGVHWTGIKVLRVRLLSGSGAVLRETTAADYLPFDGIPAGLYTLELTGEQGVLQRAVLVL